MILVAKYRQTAKNKIIRNFCRKYKMLCRLVTKCGIADKLTTIYSITGYSTIA